MFADLVLDRGRDEDVAVELEQLGIRDPFGPREPRDSSRFPLVRVDAVRIEPLRVRDRPARIGQPDNDGAELVHELRREAARVAEPLDHDSCALEVHAQVLRRLDDRVDGAACRRLVAALASSDGERFPGHDGERRIAVMHRVRVHDPGHRLSVGVDVGSRDVAIGTDQQLDLGGVAARERLQLLRAHALRIADDAAFRPAVGDADDGALPRHPHRQRLDLVQGHRRVVADATLARTACRVVLHAVAREDLHDAVGHAHREMHRQLTLRRAEDPPHVRVEMELVRRDAELLERDLPRIALGVVDDRRISLHEYLRRVMEPPPSTFRSRANHRSSCPACTRCSNS